MWAEKVNMMMEFIDNLWGVVEALGMWFLIGLIVAALLYGFVPARLFQRWLGKNSFGNVVKAAFIGVPMPLCSCGVVPTVIALRKKGASRSSCLSFLVSTPQTGVDSLMVSASFLSWPFAIFKLVSAFVIGIVGGGVHLLLEKKEPEDLAVSDAQVPAEEEKNARPSWRELYDFAVNDLFYNLWRWMLAGIVAAALISTFVSADFMAGSLFADPLYGSLAALLLSIPLYVCATSSVPIAAALVMKGMSPAVAIVFLIAGPATNIATIGLIYKSFGKLFTIVYLAAVSIGSVVCAMFFSSVISLKLPGAVHQHAGGSNALVLAGAIIFSLFMLSFMLRDAKTYLLSKSSRPKTSITLKVEGMSCQGCVGKIRKAILDQKLASLVNGEPAVGSLTISGGDLDVDKLTATIRNCGFKVADKVADT